MTNKTETLENKTKEHNGITGVVLGGIFTPMLASASFYALMQSAEDFSNGMYESGTEGVLLGLATGICSIAGMKVTKDYLTKSFGGKQE